MPRPNNKQKDIENAAIKLFASKGLSRTTIRDIASEAGVTEGALYRHYTGKEEMAWLLFSRELERFTRGLGELLFDPAMSGSAQLEAGVRYIFNFYVKEPVTFRFIMLTQHGFPERKLLKEAPNPNEMAIRFVEGLVKSGEIQPCDAIAAAAMAMGQVLQPLVWHCYGWLELTSSLVDSVVTGTRRTVGLD